MATNAKAVGYLDLNINGFDQAIKTAKNLMAGLAATFAAYKVGSFLKDGVKDAIDFGKEMQSASRAMGGFDPGALLLTQKALEKVGMGAEEARGHISDFISQGRDIGEMFGGADNYAKALKSAAEDYGSQAGVLHRSGQALQAVWNTMEAIGSKVRTFFLTMTEQFVLPLQAALDYLNEIDLASVGASFGKSIADAGSVLLGIFKNGDMFTAVQLGLTLAFQEATNYLVGALKWVSGHGMSEIGEALAKAFNSALDFLWNACSEIFGKHIWVVIFEGTYGWLVKVGTMALTVINKTIALFQAGLNYAIQSAIEKIPGADKLGFGSDAHQSFGSILDETSGPIPQWLIDSMNDTSKEMQGLFGADANDILERLSPNLNKDIGGEFKPANIFDTGETAKKLQNVIAKGFSTGAEMVGVAKEKERGADTKKVLTSFSGANSHVIADSLAKVGGGGGYLRAGMSLQERTQLEQLRAQKQGNQTLEIIRKNTETRSRPATLAR